MECGVQDPRTFFEEHAPRRLGHQAEAVLPDGVAVIFHVAGEGGGSWQVDTRDGQLRIGPMGEGLRDCEVWCSAADFMGILRGTVNARRAFLRGRIQVVGDVGLALRLQGVLAESG
jgi:hypothetical protein